MMNSIMNGKRYKIALVDDNVTNLLIGRNILKEHYEVYPVSSGARLFELLEKITPDLILLDILMPGMGGYEVIRRLKQDKRYDMIPVIFLSAMTDENSELEGLNMGAVDYVSKPFHASILRKRINNHILLAEQWNKLQYYNKYLKEEVEKKAHQVMGLQDTMLAIIAKLVEYRDGNTGNHICNTQRYLELLVNEITRQGIYRDVVSEWDTDLLIASAPLHDMGKIAISDSILNKPGKLTFEEFEIMKKHVDFGVEAIEHIENKYTNSSFLKFAKIIVGSHHEKWDGSGYPAGLAQNNIPLEGRLMAIADVYDAVVSERPYKKALSTTVAENIINKDSGTHFDPLLVGVFNKVSDEFADIAQRRNHLYIRKTGQANTPAKHTQEMFT